jgi:hypothetical protein
MMTTNDFIILGKKIFIGIVLIAIPLVIFLAGFTLIKNVLSN